MLNCLLMLRRFWKDFRVSFDQKANIGWKMANKEPRTKNTKVKNCENWKKVDLLQHSSKWRLSFQRGKCTSAEFLPLIRAVLSSHFIGFEFHQVWMFWIGSRKNMYWVLIIMKFWVWPRIFTNNFVLSFEYFEVFHILGSTKFWAFWVRVLANLIFWKENFLRAWVLNTSHSH